MVYFIIPCSVITALVSIALIAYLFRRNQEPIKSRGWMLVFSSTISFLLGAWFLSLYRDSTNLQLNIPCILIYVFTSIYMPMWLLPFFFRGLNLKYLYDYNTLKVQNREEVNKVKNIRIYQYLSSNTFWLFIYFMINIINLIVYLVIAFTDSSNPVYLNSLESSCTFNTLIIDVIWAILLVFISVYAIYVLWNVTDAYSLKTELKAFICLYPLLFILWAVSFVLSSSFPRGFSTYVVMVGGMVTTCISLLYPLVESFRSKWSTIHPNLSSISNNSHTHKHSGDLFTFCLQNNIIMEEFKLFCVEMWCAENVQFYLDARKFKTYSHDTELMTQEASHIIRSYFADDASFPINVDERIRLDVLDKFSSRQIDESLFNESIKSVMIYMRQDTFGKFQLSKKLHHAWEKAGLGKFDPTSTFVNAPSQAIVDFLEMEGKY